MESGGAGRANGSRRAIRARPLSRAPAGRWRWPAAFATMPPMKRWLTALLLVALAGEVTLGAAAVRAAESPARPKSALPFISNDYPKALSEARARGLPLFIDAWAPW